MAIDAVNHIHDIERIQSKRRLTLRMRRATLSRREMYMNCPLEDLVHRLERPFAGAGMGRLCGTLR
jgi:hypothetical protein